MKILFLTHFYPPTHIGGTETYTHGLARGLVQAGHQVQVLCAGDWESGRGYWNGFRDDVYEQVPVRRLQLNWTQAPDPNRYLYDNPAVADYLAKYLAEFKPDLVHVTSCITLSASVIGVVKRAGLPVVLSLTDFWFICPRVTLLRSNNELCNGQVTEQDCLECMLRGTKAYQWSSQLLPAGLPMRLVEGISRHGSLTRHSGLRGMALDIRHRRMVLRQALQLADRILIASHAARDFFIGNAFTMPIEVMPYGHDLSWLRDYPGKLRSDAVRFAFIGQIAPMKGPQLLIEAFRRLRPVGQARLLIYGNLGKDSGFGQSLRALANGRSDVEFRGTYPHETSGKVFSEIDVLVVPSLWYDYPLIINEAFATGTPVITGDFGGMREFVQHNVNGLLFKRGDVQDLAAQLERIVAEPGLLDHLRGGIPHVKRMDEAVAEMADIYRALVNPKLSTYHAPPIRNKMSHAEEVPDQ